MKERIIFIVGPTALGKTEVAVCLAKRISAEIISCDSMQVYRGMDILTAKPSAALRKKVPHHLIDILSPSREYNVSQYRKQAIRKIKEIIRNGKTPVFVGGTGLYASIVIDGIFKMPPYDRNIHVRLTQQLQDEGGDFLYARLKKLDPLAAGKIHPHDTRRIIRALEVFEITGKPISQLQQERKGLADKYDISIFGLSMPRPKLYQRIDRRVERMFTQGLAQEVKRLLQLKLSHTAASALGIKELQGYFSGRYDLPETKRLIKKNTRLYAKRQLTWFRKDKRIHWIEVGKQDKAQSIADKILETFPIVKF